MSQISLCVFSYSGEISILSYLKGPIYTTSIVANKKRTPLFYLLMSENRMIKRKPGAAPGQRTLLVNTIYLLDLCV